MITKFNSFINVDKNIHLENQALHSFQPDAMLKALKKTMVKKIKLNMTISGSERVNYRFRKGIGMPSSNTGCGCLGF